MTDVTADGASERATPSAAAKQLLRELTERPRPGGLKLTGEGGLLEKLTKMVIEGALEGELDDHLGYGKHDPAGRNSGNSRNGHRAKAVLTETRPTEISGSCPRSKNRGTRDVCMLVCDGLVVRPESCAQGLDPPAHTAS